MTLNVSQLSPVKPQPVIIEEKGSPKKPFKRTLLSILYKTQRYSAYSFMTFYGLHISTVNLLPGLHIPMEACQDMFEMARLVYVPMSAMIGLSSGIHIASGLAIRYLNSKSANHHKRVSNNNDLVTSADTDDKFYGLGGITSLVGLGSRKSIVSRVLGLSPISFSGFLLMPLIGFHVFKFKESVISVDGDRSLVSLQYINAVLNNSLIKYGNAINYIALVLLIIASSYHITAGMLRFQRKFLVHSKRFGYGVVAGMTVVGVSGLLRLKTFDFDNAYLARSFMRYISFTQI